MLCTIAIPARMRYGKLVKCIRSVYQSSGQSGPRAKDYDFEVLIRLHRSDRAMHAKLEQLYSGLEPGQGFRVIYGDDLGGYKGLSMFYHELIQASLGDFVWHINDDMQIFAPAEGPGWVDALANVATEGTRCLIQPQHHRLNVSDYQGHEAGPSPCHARDALKGKFEYWHSRGQHQVDLLIYQDLVKERGWPVKYMSGIGTFHDWDGPGGHVDLAGRKESE